MFIGNRRSDLEGLEKISKAVKALCIQLITQSPRGWKWILSLPLYHFTYGLSKPFVPLPTHPHSVKWVFWDVFEEVKLKPDVWVVSTVALAGHVKPLWSFFLSVKRFWEAWTNTEVLREVDAVLTQVFVRVCPEEELSELLKLLEPTLSTSFLVHRTDVMISTSKTWTTKHVRVSHEVVDYIYAVIKEIF